MYICFKTILNMFKKIVRNVSLKKYGFIQEKKKTNIFLRRKI